MSRPLFPGRAHAPSLDDFAELARRAYAALPEIFRAQTGDVVFRIEDFAAEEVLEELEIDDPFELSGLYSGVDLGRRETFDPNPHECMVFLYRRPILDEWAARGDVTLEELVTHVLIHEIGHHLGLSDDDIDRIEAE